jgi:tetratricopeptide (TPR) repeat protein
MRKTLDQTLVVTVAVLLAACSGPVQRRGPPAPVQHRGQAEVAPADTDRGGADLSAYVPPTRPRVARPASAKAVQVLSRRADEQARGGDLGAAVASLERALRIEPRNATVWYRLARVRADQGDYTLAEELARKSISLASAYDLDLKRNNWELIAGARRAQGNVTGAREAEQQAARFD